MNFEKLEFLFMKKYTCFMSTNIVLFSDSDLNVRNDNEIQAFRDELILSRSMKSTNQGEGCGIKAILIYFPYKYPLISVKSIDFLIYI